MLQRAVEDGIWDVVMLGFPHDAPERAHAVFPRTIANRVGTLLMFVVRNIFSQAGAAEDRIARAGGRRQLPRWLDDAPNPLGFLIHEQDGGAANVTEAAYRFVRHEPGVDVVLFGTGDPRASAHQHRLDPEAAAARNRPPHPCETVRPSGRRRPRPPTYMPGLTLH